MWKYPLSIYVMLTVLVLLVATCLVLPYLQKRPYYKGHSINWHWSSQLDHGDANARRESIRVLSEALQDKDPDVRLEAVKVLKLACYTHPDEMGEAIPALQTALSDNEEEVRRVATDAIMALSQNQQNQERVKARP
jgi:hypothetical protein